MATKSNATKELGASSSYDQRSVLKADEFLPALRGRQAIMKYREMKDNDPIIGAILMAIEMLLRGAELRIEPADESAEAEEAAEFLRGVFDDMEHTTDEFLSEAASVLPFGFALFEVVYKIRGGESDDETRDSMFDDGRYGIRKLAPRAQWTVERFEYDQNGKILGVTQNSVWRGTYATTGQITIPMEKMIHFRTSTANNDPAGRSILRNAYTSYHYATHIEMIEAIAIEREMNGIPVGRIPAEYLATGASTAQTAFVNQFKKILRDVKFNDQGYVLLPSDLYSDDEGNLTDKRLVEFELLTASGTRAIPTGETVKRHQQNIARSVLADFLTLGQGDKGSFALSKSKTDLFLAAALGFTEMIAATLRRQLVAPLWNLNGMDKRVMPYIVFGDIAPADLEELGTFIQQVAGAGMPLFPDEELEATIRATAGWPERTDDASLMGNDIEDEE